MLTVASALILMGLAPALLAAPAAPPRDDPAALQNWIDRISSADEQVRAGDYRGAKRHIDRLLDETSQRIHSGGGVGELLGMAAAVRALAEAGLGNERDALWDWQIARVMAPRFESLDLAAYGQAGRFLQEAATGLPDEAKRNEWDAVEDRGRQDVTAPVKLRGPKPSYPAARLVNCLEDVLVAQTVIGEDGATHFPTILSSPSEVASFAVLDVLREWRFKPAQVKGEPVAVVFRLTAHFEVPYCEDALARWRKRQAELEAGEE